MLQRLKGGDGFSMTRRAKKKAADPKIRRPVV
jgi:hypothetical protein